MNSAAVLWFVLQATHSEVALGMLVATFLLFGAIASRGMDATDPLVSARQGIDRISPALLSCASSGLYYEVTTDEDISAALTALFNKAIATARLSQ